MGLVTEAVPVDELDATVDRLAARIAGVPRSHSDDAQDGGQPGNRRGWGCRGIQMFATLFDGIILANPRACGFAGMRRPTASRTRWPGAIPVSRFRSGDEARLG